MSFLYMPLFRPLTPSFFFFNDTATTEIYTLSLHDALPISTRGPRAAMREWAKIERGIEPTASILESEIGRATSELQSQFHLVCRLLLEKKKKIKISNIIIKKKKNKKLYNKKI